MTYSLTKRRTEKHPWLPCWELRPSEKQYDLLPHQAEDWEAPLTPLLRVEAVREAIWPTPSPKRRTEEHPWIPHWSEGLRIEAVRELICLTPSLKWCWRTEDCSWGWKGVCLTPSLKWCWRTEDCSWGCEGVCLTPSLRWRSSQRGCSSRVSYFPPLG
jgi:hypothetical protein